MLLFYNRYSQALAREQAAAGRAGVVPVEVPGSEFDSLVEEGDRMIYVVVGDRLLVSKRSRHVSHAVLAGGEPVQAAGEFEVMAEYDTKVVTALNNMSGHYQPDESSLTVAAQAFEDRGLQVQRDGIRGYDWLQR